MRGTEGAARLGGFMFKRAREVERLSVPDCTRLV